MGTCQNCGKKNVMTQAIEMAGSSRQVCAECYSKIEENRAIYARRKAEAEDHERKSKAEYNERKASGE
jgi:ribosome-binding protein aMBF1 (putative translation factor)